MKELDEERDNILIVPTNKNYTYDILKQNLNELKRAYPFIKIKNIGYSVLGKGIPCLKIGSGAKQVLYHSGIHANEWITCVLLMKFVENFCNAYIFKQTLNGYNVLELFNQVSLYVVPMVNPDGVDLVTRNVLVQSPIYKNYLQISSAFPDIPFPNGWKANFNGESLINFHLFVFKK